MHCSKCGRAFAAGILACRACAPVQLGDGIQAVSIFPALVRQIQDGLPALMADITAHEAGDKEAAEADELRLLALPTNITIQPQTASFTVGGIRPVVSDYHLMTNNSLPLRA